MIDIRPVKGGPAAFVCHNCSLSHYDNVYTVSGNHYADPLNMMWHLYSHAADGDRIVEAVQIVIVCTR